MKVFAHYLGSQNNNIWNCSKDGFQYRWRTLLQFGDSWEIIGSIFMKNPGSAAPIGKQLSDDIIAHLIQFDNSSEKWFEFTADNTMSCIERLFIAKQGGTALNGVVQIFNLMNIRSADLSRALSMSVRSTEKVFSTIEEDVNHIDSTDTPVYLGWGNLGKSGRFYENASIVFEKVVNKNKYLDKDFHKNPFYHPQYLMGYGKNRFNCQWLLMAFHLNSREFTFDYQEPYIQANRLKENAILEFLENTYNVTGKRFGFCPDYDAVIEKGCLKIRFSKRNEHNSFNLDEYEGIDVTAIIDMLCEQYGYTQTERMWFGQKRLSEFGGSEETVANSISNELMQIEKSLANIITINSL